jgi:serine/threonine protein kinase/tetratricopeptide (TPR) repeat protein
MADDKLYRVGSADDASGRAGEVTRLLGKEHPAQPLATRHALSEVERELFARTPSPITVSRYVILDRIGSGGAGVVYRAYDPELDRKVAVKLLHPDTLDDRDTDESSARARLLREAQAMARLSHPNVVAVHDVGTYDEDKLRPAGELGAGASEGVFVVMELLEGRDLSQWLAEERPGWRETVAMFLQAGRGLSAAHAKRIIHRDFKPANVHIDGQGQARVLDFGLARGLLHEPEIEVPTASDSGGRPIDSPLTEHGVIMGTPAYMAPEQHAGGTTDERTDQYNFCVAFYEALYGQRPFQGKNLDSLAEAKRMGRRGLEADPGRRFSDMDALLAALEHDPGARLRRAMLGLVALALAAGMVVAGSRWYSSRLTMCEGYEQELAGIWDTDVRARVGEAFRATGTAYAQRTSTSVARVLDEYVAGWTQARKNACETALSGARQNPAVIERQVLCLERRLQAVHELVRLFIAADREIVENALAAVNALPVVRSCDRFDDPAYTLPTDAEAQTEISKVSDEVARASASLAAGKYQEGLEIARASVSNAQDTGHLPTLARALMVSGQLEHLVGDAGRAEQQLFEAFLASESAGDHDTGTRALIARIAVLSTALGRLDEAVRVADQVQARLRRDSEDRELEAMLAFERGRIHLRRAAYAEALDAHRRALSLREQWLGPDHLSTARIVHAMADVHYKLRDFAAARAQAERALAVWERSVGEGHPNTAGPMHLLAHIAYRQGRYEDARAMAQRAYDISSSASGPDHPVALSRLAALASVLSRMGRHREAIAAQRKVLSGFRSQRGDDHPSARRALGSLGNILLRAGAHEEAEQALRRALEALGDTEGVPDAAYFSRDLAALLRETGRAEEGIPLLERAIELWTRERGEDHPKLSWAFAGLGDTYLDLGERAKAIATLERAIELHDPAVADPHDLADMRFSLARALLDDDRGRAQALARQARDFFEASPYGQERLALVDAWLERHAQTDASKE